LKYQRLTSAEKWAVVRRMAKVYATHRHPERPAAMRKIIQQIAQELREKKPQAQQ
jgi:hypothetical protein